MRAATVTPGRPDDLRVSEWPEPVAASGELLVEGLLVGLCHTDLEIINGRIDALPPGQDRMVLFHESLGRVLEAPAGSGFAPGDLVAGVVRRPDPLPCAPCAAGRSDFCLNGNYTERGVSALDGFGSERWAVPVEYAAKLAPEVGDCGVLAEPTSIVAKAWDQVDIIGGRTFHAPQRVLITGAGPIGLLAAMLGVQRGLEVHVLDRIDHGVKPELVRALGATYHLSLDTVPTVDVVIECTGAGPLMFDSVLKLGRNAVAVLLGLSTSDAAIPLAPARLNDTLVFGNAAVVGSVNSAPAHFRTAAQALAKADQDWLRRLITRRVPLSDWPRALELHDDIKVVVELDR
ncbi:glucose 1-dehydrogenase [Kutzneria sp. 744]|uniref:glucose 1-dehydrogenase n=1 Tax=Kutzneria sp. (strain 744) TaxID=345341 RepID=UPI0003EEDBD9|nr:glucose 1-dehydrogenase [Kutzneria sp. 744]EWM15123.1 oxidoreductase, zinc-binding dehydrogenase family [Kutzneria sp. 744]